MDIVTTTQETFAQPVPHTLPSHMAHLYVIGGQQRNLRPLRAGGNDWYDYQMGVILELDAQTGTARTRVRYQSPPEACAAEDPVILFKSCTMVGNTLYTCTQTEVLIYQLPSFQQIGYVSLPMFNDLHHVRPTPEGHLLVANTGLDMVVEVSQEGSLLRQWNVLGNDPWAQFSPAIDYRRGVSTKPHQAHPNYVFYLGEEPWVTRFQQKDARSLTHPQRRIAIDIERPHDGVLSNNNLYFTTVNGWVVIVNPATLRVEEAIALQPLHDEQVLLGWCRSILVDGDLAWIGFSRLRPTRFRENVSWVRNGFKTILPTHIALYNLARRRCLAEIALEPFGLNAVFGVCSGEPKMR